MFPVLSGDTNKTIDAGLISSSVGDYVWLDKNANGFADLGEGPFQGVTVRLLAENGTILQSTTTDNSGAYKFDGLDPDKQYRVQFVAPAGYTHTKFGPVTENKADPDNEGKTPLFQVTAGEFDKSYDGGLVKFGSVGDFVWQDTNSDGIQDTGEPGMPLVTVKLLDNGNVVKTTSTDANGRYRFDDLDPSKQYQVQFVAPTGASLSPFHQGTNSAADSDADPNNAGKSQPLNVPGGTFKTDIDAGMVSTSVGDRVWNDKNSNGIQDPLETGLNGVTVRLLNVAGTVVQTTMTNADGLYRFDGLDPAQQYAIEVVPPAGFTFTFFNRGNDGTLDSDVGSSDGQSNLFQVPAGRHNATIDAGLVTIGSVNTIVGPAVVLGNSQYTYTITLNGPATNLHWRPSADAKEVFVDCHRA